MHSIRFDADKKLIDYVQKKADKLDRFYDRIVDGEVFLRLDRDDGQENKIVEIKLNIPGSQLFVAERSRTFEAAADTALESLKRQLKKFKEKQNSH